MAKDWILMRCDLHTHPKVVRIMSRINRTNPGQKTDIFRTVGGLHAVWSLFDAHTEDGNLAGYTLELLGEMIRWPGFPEAMAGEEWLIVNGPNVICPRFDEHNSKSAKHRAEEVARKRASRKRPDSVRDLSGKIRTKSGLQNRTEQNIKSKNTPLPPSSENHTSAETALPGAAPSSLSGELIVTDSQEPAPELPAKPKKPLEPIMIPDVLAASDDFLEAWEEWQRHRREIKKPLTPTQRNRQLIEMAEKGPERSAEAIRFTTGKGWQGLVWPDEERGHGKQQQQFGGKDNLSRSLDVIANFAAGDQQAGLRQVSGSPLRLEANSGVQRG